MASIDPERTGSNMKDLITEHWFVNPSLPTKNERYKFLAMGLSVDDDGRPFHPWIDILEKENRQHDKGVFYNWGPNYTVDTVVLTSEDDPKVLLIKRNITGEWALPGGFIDESEPELDAAKRELKEETDLQVDTPWTQCYSGPVADPRTTLHAWPETTAYFTFIPAPKEVKAGDDASESEWIPLRDVASMELYGSHKSLIEAALRAHDAMTREASKTPLHQ